MASATVMMMWLVTVKAYGNQPDHVQRQHEHEKREDEGKKFHPFRAGSRADGCSHELVRKFCRRLQAGRHQAAPGRCNDQERGESDDCQHHEGRRICEGDLDIADLRDRKEIDNLKLVDWIDGHEH